MVDDAYAYAQEAGATAELDILCDAFPRPDTVWPGHSVPGWNMLSADYFQQLVAKRNRSSKPEGKVIDLHHIL